MLSVQIVLFDGFDLLDAIAPYEVFCAAEMFAKQALSVEFVTAEGPRSVTSGINGIQLEASNRLDPERAGIILVPGASGALEGDGPDTIPAILVKAMNTALTGVIRQALSQHDIIVATVCGGSLVLAMGGLLEGRPAVTNRLGMDLLGASGAIPISARVVDDGNLVTGGGVTSGLDVALHLVERELGPRIAHAVEQLFEFERRGTVWRQAGIALSTHHASSSDASNTANIANKVTMPLNTLSDFNGVWDTIIATPVGKMQVKLSISAKDGIIQGTATQGEETIKFINPLLQDNHLTWSMPVSKPMRLNLKFDITVEGDQITGIAKAGVLPASKLTGLRIH